MYPKSIWLIQYKENKATSLLVILSGPVEWNWLWKGTYIVKKKPYQYHISFLRNQPANFNFLPQQMKCRGNYIKIHFVLAFPRQCFLPMLAVFSIKNLGKTSARTKLVRLFPLLHISPRIRSILCTVRCNTEFFSTEKCNHDCEQALMKSSWGSV